MACKDGGLIQNASFALVLTALLSAVPASGQSGEASPLSPLADKGGEASRPRPTNALDKSDLEFYLRHLYVWRPEINVSIGEPKPSPVEGLLAVPVRASYKNAVDERTIYVSEDGAQVLQARIFDIGKNPFQDNLETITTEDQPAFGKPGAPVVIVSYSDFQCPYCAKEAEILRSRIPKEFPEQVRVYFRDFPLAGHDWATQAAVAGRCIYQQDPEKFWAYHDWIFANQESVNRHNLEDKISAFAAGHGVDTLKLSPCLSDPATARHIRESIAEGRSLGISSTPTLFVNGRKLSGAVDWEKLKQVIENEIEYQKVAQDAGDDCGCEVPIQLPGSE